MYKIFLKRGAGGRAGGQAGRQAGRQAKRLTERKRNKKAEREGERANIKNPEHSFVSQQVTNKYFNDFYLNKLLPNLNMSILP